jgi:hypothetical protein
MAKWDHHWFRKQLARTSGASTIVHRAPGGRPRSHDCQFRYYLCGDACGLRAAKPHTLVVSLMGGAGFELATSTV